MSETHTGLDAIVERLGRAFEATSGMTRIAGRILALLLLEEGPFSFDDLARRLKISRASISTNSRTLERRGAIERISELGDRRDFFRLADQPFVRLVEDSLETLAHTARVVEDAERELPAEMSAARARLARAAGVHRAAAGAVQSLLDELRASGA